jgi:hypothetical protein
MIKRNNILLNPIFISSLLILAINDHILKYYFNNWLTGKLSDFAGLIVLPLFLSFLFPKLSKWTCFISALFFIYWKTKFSDSLIDFINKNDIVIFSRVIDFTDFVALIVLPIPWTLINDKKTLTLKSKFVSTFFLVLFTFCVLTATSIRKGYILKPEGTITINQKHELKVPKDTVLARINQLGYSYEISNNLYIIKDVIVPEIRKKREYLIKQDTIKEITFSFINFYYQPTKKQQKLGAQYLCIHDVKFSDVNTITDWKVMKNYSKLYAEITEKLFAKESTKK